MKALSLDRLIAYGHAHAQRVLIGQPGAQLMPFFHIQFKNRPDAILAAQWNNDAEKSAFIGALRSALQALRGDIVSYSFLTEAWVATQARPWRAGDLRPSKRESRTECVIVNACDGLNSRFGMWEIIRDAEGRVTDLVEQPQSGCQLQGRLVNLLEN
jgi:hypothetical protein